MDGNVKVITREQFMTIDRKLLMLIHRVKPGTTVPGTKLTMVIDAPETRLKQKICDRLSLIADSTSIATFAPKEMYRGMQELKMLGSDISIVSVKRERMEGYIALYIQCDLFSTLFSVWRSCMLGHITQMFKPFERSCRDKYGSNDIEINVCLTEDDFFGCCNIIEQVLSPYKRRSRNIADTDKIRKLQRELYKWIEKKDEIIRELYKLANELDEDFRKISAVKVSGSYMSIVGGAMATVGFGLSFFTFGASLELALVGGIMAGTGSVAVAGSEISDAILSNKSRKKAEVLLKDYNDILENLKMLSFMIGNILEDYGNINESFPYWVRFWGKVILGNKDVRDKDTTWEVLTGILLSATRMAGTCMDDVVASGARFGATAFKTIGSTAGKGLRIVGGVAGILMLPLDINTFVDARSDLFNNNPHKVSTSIRQNAMRVLIECPTKEEVDTMIEKTLRALE